MEIWYILIINTIISILFIIFTKDKDQKIFGFFFIVVPVFGFVFYFIPKFIFRISKKHNLYDDSNIKVKVSKESVSKKPDVNEELNVVSFNEVMHVGLNDEKRSLLISAIKDDLIENAAFIQSAMSDKDSETTHYAASATMLIFTKLKTAIQELELQHQLQPENSTLALDLLSAISNYLKSGVLNKRESDFYSNKYIRVFNELKENKPTSLTCDAYLNMIDFQYLSQDVHGSINTAIEAREKFNREETHIKLLEQYYKTGNQSKFEEAFTRFTNSKLSISSNGLDFVRFWNKRLN